MRCNIFYRRGPFTGYTDFGIANPDDPVIAQECAKLRAEGCTIIKVWIT